MIRLSAAKVLGGFHRFNRELEKGQNFQHTLLQMWLDELAGKMCEDDHAAISLAYSLNELLNNYGLSLFFRTSDGTFEQVRVRFQAGGFHIHKTGKVPTGVSRTLKFPTLIAARTKELAEKHYAKTQRGATNAQ